MCLILLALDVHPGYPVVLAANRDEFTSRPTAPAGFWRDEPDILAGRDLEAGGTWLGVGPGERWAAVTNVREPARHRRKARSRGELVTGFLRAGTGPEACLEEISGRGDQYNGFNLLLAQGDAIWYDSNRSGAARRVDAGIHAVSNAALDTPWPKVVKGREAMAEVLAEGAIAGPASLSGLEERLFRLLSSEERAADGALPATGVGLEKERVLSSIRIRSDGYGTRCSTVLLRDRNGRLTLAERTFGPSGLVETRRFIYSTSSIR